MYIEPRTNIRLLQNVPIDSSYIHTLWFDSEAQQRAYMLSKTKYNLTNYTYQRVNKGVARIGINAENLYDCDYMMFQNTSFGNKWFYAFINKIEYVNNDMCEIYFTIDVIQTWLGEAELQQCFVEREHTESDAIGEHTLDENIPIGYYVTPKKIRTNFANFYSYVAFTAYDIDNGEFVSGGLYGGIYSGLKHKVFDSTEALDDWLIRMNNAGKSDAVISVTMLPSIYTSFVTTTDSPPLEIAQYINMKDLNLYSTIDGYKPRNNKMFCYPYNVLYVHNGTDTGVTYKIEHLYREDENLVFDILATDPITSSPMIRPRRYLGIDYPYQYGVELGGFPQCAYNTDFYRAYSSLHANRNAATVASNIMGAGTSMATTYANTNKVTEIPSYTLQSAGVSAATAGGLIAAGVTTAGTALIVGAAVGAVMGIGKFVAEQADLKNQPPVIRGTQQSDLMVAMKAKDFYFEKRCVKSEVAKEIDDYFTAFGYKVARVKTPNRDVRKEFTYTKTVGCIVRGSLPADDATRIESIYDNGITFWRNPNNVGKYTLDNSPIVREEI